jgi:hypothetical protein
MPLQGWHGCVFLRNSLEVERKAEAIAVKHNISSNFLLEQKKEDTQSQQSYSGKHKIKVT